MEKAPPQLEAASGGTLIPVSDRRRTPRRTTRARCQVSVTQDNSVAHSIIGREVADIVQKSAQNDARRAPGRGAERHVGSGRNDRLERGIGLEVRLAQVARPICLGCYRTVELPTTAGDSLPVIHIAPMAESNNYD